MDIVVKALQEALDKLKATQALAANLTDEKNSLVKAGNAVHEQLDSVKRTLGNLRLAYAELERDCGALMRDKRTTSDELDRLRQRLANACKIVPADELDRLRAINAKQAEHIAELNRQQLNKAQAYQATLDDYKQTCSQFRSENHDLLARLGRRPEFTICTDMPEFVVHVKQPKP